jgi:hypothetical protein
MIENLMMVEVPTVTSDHSAGDSAVSEFTECHSASGVDTNDILRLENETTHLVSQVEESQRDKMVDDMVLWYSNWSFRKRR